MKTQKPDRSIAGMEVLNDIRGLLSSTREGASSTKSDVGNEANLRGQTARLQKDVASYKQMVLKQQDELERLESEKIALAAKLSLAASSYDEARFTNPTTQELSEEITHLEQRKVELSSALSEIEDLLQLKVKDLLRRIAWLYDEAGQGDIALEFRSAGNELQKAANFASFLRALLNE